MVIVLLVAVVGYQFKPSGFSNGLVMELFIIGFVVVSCLLIKKISTDGRRKYRDNLLNYLVSKRSDYITNDYTVREDVKELHYYLEKTFPKVDHYNLISDLELAIGRAERANGILKDKRIGEISLSSIDALDE